MLSSRAAQRKVFEAQLEAFVRSKNKPLFVHLREPDSVTYSKADAAADSGQTLPAIPSAIEDLIETFHRVTERCGDEVSLEHVIVHCFTNDFRTIQRLLTCDIRIGLTGYIGLSKRAEKSGTLQAIKDSYQKQNEFLEKVMIETDAPYMRPDKALFPEKVFKLLKRNRGGHNEPATLPITCTVLANLVGKSPSDVAKQTAQNAIKFFKLHVADAKITAFLEKAKCH